MDVTTHGHFIVCGLGSLGQHCVRALKEFGAEFRVVAIAAQQPPAHDISDLEELIDQWIIGDCCQDATLKKAEISACRAALIVTSDERINAETALAIRKLSPQTRLVIRSGKNNFNQLLQQYLGNFIAFEPTELPSLALAWTALGTENLAWFSLNAQWLRVVEKEVTRSNDQPLGRFNRRDRFLLQHHPKGQTPEDTFYNWQLDSIAEVGDHLIYLETTTQLSIGRSSVKLQSNKLQLWWKNLKDWRSLSFAEFWQLSLQQKLRSIAFISGAIIFCLLLIGTGLFHSFYPQGSLLGAFYGTAVLLLGGYGDLFGGWQDIPNLPWWLQLFALSLSVVGTAFVGVLYALLTEALLSSRFRFQPARLPIPKQDHVVLVGLGRVGSQIARLLQEFKQPLVAIALDTEWEQRLDRKIPVLKKSLQTSIKLANVNTAKSVILATSDEMVNLEAALLVRDRNPEIPMILRAYGQRLSDHLASILPDAQILSVYAVMAEAFAGAAFGENILSLFRLNNQTILVTEYNIEAHDTLHGLLLSDIAYGYGVVPISHTQKGCPAVLLPSEDLPLHVGDRLVVLASIKGLKQIELGNLAPKTYQLRIEKLGYPDAAFEAANVIARISGCPLKVARDVVQNLPQTLRVPLYWHTAERLIHDLKKLQITAQIKDQSLSQ